MLVHPYWHQFGPVEQYAHTIALLVFIFIMIFGGFGNMMVILFHLRYNNQFVSLFIFNTFSSILLYILSFERIRRSTTFLMINLAVADLFFVVTNLPLAIYNTMYGKWMFEKTG
jgi:hypothetical protein